MVALFLLAFLHVLVNQFLYIRHCFDIFVLVVVDRILGDCANDSRPAAEG